MAAASTQKLQDIVECPICLETLTEPRMFGCFHFYCQKCVHDMKEVKQDETVGYECPLCRKFTAKGQLQSLPIMGQLLEAINVAKSESEKCGKCKIVVPKWRCLDCKKFYCDECKLHHDDFELFQSHQWEQCGDAPKAVVDKIVFCDVHPSKQVELHCRDCKELICLLCNGTTHKQHTAETIEKALQQILPVVRQNQEKVKAMIVATKADISQAKAEEQESEKQHDDLDNEIKRRHDVILSRLRADYNKLSKQVQALRDDVATKHKTRVEQLELQLQSQENVLSLSQSTLDTAQNISLLKALQSGVLDSLNGSLEGAGIVPEVEKRVTVFKTTDVTDDNMLGCIKDQFKGSCQLEISCDDLTRKKFTKQKENKLGFTCSRFDIINGGLWCIEFGTTNIHIYSLEMVERRTIKHDACGEVRSIVEFNDKALVSARNGLFTVSTGDCNDVTKVYNGDFCDSSVGKTHVYALVAGDPGKVCVSSFDSRSRMLHKQNEFEVIATQNKVGNTIQVTPDFVWVGDFNKHVIKQYTHDGHLVREHGKNGKNIGELHHPLLSGGDSFNNILIAGNYNYRLDFLKKSEGFNTLPTSGFDSNVMCARIHDGTLYVALWNSKCIKVFSIT